jgi:DNA-binding CsgD family transcriptional regulator
MTHAIQEMLERPMLVKLPPPAKLTARQVEVLTLIACGKSTKEVAVHLGISVKTAMTHRSMLYKILGIHEVATLTLYCVREGFVEAV